jgi:hypothetical protein
MTNFITNTWPWSWILALALGFGVSGFFMWRVRNEGPAVRERTMIYLSVFSLLMTLIALAFR